MEYLSFPEDDKVNKIQHKIKIEDEFQESNSSKDDDEFTIKPPQTSSKLDSVVHHKDKKKRKHSKEHKSCKRHHHHHHKYEHLKSPNAVFYSKGKMKSKSFHYGDSKEKVQMKELKKNLSDHEITDMTSRKTVRYITENKLENFKCQGTIDFEHINPVEDSKSSKSYSDINRKRDTIGLDELHAEWEKKRLLYFQQQKKHERLFVEKEKDKNCKKEFKEQYERMHMTQFGSRKNSPYCIKIDDDEKDFSLVSPEESMDYQDSEKHEEVVDEKNELVSDHTRTIELSDSSTDAGISSEEETMESESADENEKGNLQNKSQATKPAEEAEAVVAFKEENINAKSAKEKQIIPVAQGKFPALKASEIHAPKCIVYYPAIQGCRSIEEFQMLNRIEEGTYGVVYRAKDKLTKEIVALKRLKMEKEKNGFPITSLREINTLFKAQHPNIVTVREIVVGDHIDKIFIVMDYVEHDLKSLMKTMPRPFLLGEVKTLLLQLLSAVAHLHDNWILHRDLKTSNLLLSHHGILKVGDFGLAREYGSPLKSYTPVVVTLWYRAPELLLGAKKYSTPIDMWSVGCIFSELMTRSPLFPGRSESDQINRIFKVLGTPTEDIWPGYKELPLVQSIKIPKYPYNYLKHRFSHITSQGFDLLNKFLTYDPARRISAEKAKGHEFFNEKPRPVPPNMFPTWPAKSELYHEERSSPRAPAGGLHYSRL